MNIIKSLSKYGLSPLSKLLSSTPTLSILSYLLQSYFFSQSIISFFQIPLKMINFPYSKAVLQNSITKIIISLLFFIVEIWHYQYSTIMQMYAYICATFIALYVYDGCIRISEAYVARVRGMYWVQVFCYVVGVMVLPLAMLMRGYGKGVGVGIGVLLGVLMLVLVIVNAVKNKHIIYSATVCLIYISIPFLRHLTPSTPYTLSLPLQLLPCLLLSFQSQYLQHKETTSSSTNSTNENSTIFLILKSCSFYLLYYTMTSYKRYVYLQVVGIGVALFVGVVRWKL